MMQYGSPGGQLVVNCCHCVSHFTVCVGKPADDRSERFGTLIFLGAKALRQGRGS